MALSLLLSIFLLWSLVSTATAFNITKILDQHPDYAVFNQLLTKTHVAQEINKRKSITVLAVPNGAVSGITGQDEETLKVIMKIHVVLDYYDSAKIKKIKDDTTLTTLYQTTGSADKEEGFLRIIKDDNDIKLTSAVSGSSVTARVSKVVTSIPSDISVVEVSNAIMPPGLDGSPISPSPSSTSKHKSPSPSPNKSSSPKSSDAPDADDSKSAPSDSDAPAPSPKGKDHGHGHKHKHKHAPASAPAPSDDSADADADDDDADADADDNSSPDEEDNSTGDEDDDSSSPRNAAVSGFVLLASLFAML